LSFCIALGWGACFSIIGIDIIIEVRGLSRSELALRRWASTFGYLCYEYLNITYQGYNGSNYELSSNDMS